MSVEVRSVGWAPSQHDQCPSEKEKSRRGVCPGREPGAEATTPTEIREVLLQARGRQRQPPTRLQLGLGPRAGSLHGLRRGEF